MRQSLSLSNGPLQYNHALCNVIVEVFTFTFLLKSFRLCIPGLNIGMSPQHAMYCIFAFANDTYNSNIYYFPQSEIVIFNLHYRARQLKKI